MDDFIMALTKGLAYTENGGKPKAPKAGKSGEMKSIFQFLPSTWKLYSKQILGKEVPLTSENEAAVVYKKVADWVDHLRQEGTPDNEIPLKVASMWNAGERKPDAYKQGWRGTNSSGVKYDTPAYAKKVADYTAKFLKENQGQPSPANSPAPAQAPTNPGLIGQKPTMPNAPDTIGGLLSVATNTPQG